MLLVRAVEGQEFQLGDLRSVLACAAKGNSLWVCVPWGRASFPTLSKVTDLRRSIELVLQPTLALWK